MPKRRRGIKRISTNGYGFMGKKRHELQMMTLKVVIPKEGANLEWLEHIQHCIADGEVGMLGLTNKVGACRPMTDSEWKNLKVYFAP